MHLILGGGGFIGRHVALALARSGHRVVIANRSARRLAFPAELSGLITWTDFDLATADWDRLIGAARVVHHYAWGTIPATANADPIADLAINVQATLGLLEAARRRASPPVVVFSSSGGTVYGRLRSVPVTEDHPIAPITAYGASKATIELYLGYYRAIHGLDCRVARLANPFGAGQDLTRGQGAATLFVNLALHNQPIQIWGDGEVVRDYLHVTDAAAGLVKLASAQPLRGPWTFNISSGQGVSLNGIVAELEARLGRRLALHHKPSRSFDIPVSILDPSLAWDVLGWAPKLSFADGIGRTIDDVLRKADIAWMD